MTKIRQPRAEERTPEGHITVGYLKAMLALVGDDSMPVIVGSTTPCAPAEIYCSGGVFGIEKQCSVAHCINLTSIEGINFDALRAAEVGGLP